MAEIININNIQKKSKTAVDKAFEALRAVQNFCNSQYQEDCDSGKCPLFKWCMVSGDRMEYPCNWTLNE